MSKPSALPRRRNEQPAPDPRVLRCVRQLALAGLALVLVWPAARGNNDWIGWLPLWLVGMPLTAWWALYRFQLPAVWRNRKESRAHRRMPQARRLRRRMASRLTRAA